MIGQCFIAVEEGPAGRSDLIVVALRRAIHAELWRAIAKMVSSPVPEAAFHRLEDAAPRGATLLPLPRQRALRRERRVLVVRVVRLNPRAGQADLKVFQWLVDQRPDRSVESHASGVAAFGRQLFVAESDVTVKPLRMGCDNTDAGGCVLTCARPRDERDDSDEAAWMCLDGHGLLATCVRDNVGPAILPVAQCPRW